MKRAFALVLALILVMTCFAGCGKKKESSIAGTYNLVSMTADGTTIKIADLEEAVGESLEAYIKLNADGTGVMVMEGDKTDMEYADGMIWPVGSEDEKVAFSIVGKTMTLEADGISMVFEK